MHIYPHTVSLHSGRYIPHSPGCCRLIASTDVCNTQLHWLQLQQRAAVRATVAGVLLPRESRVMGNGQVQVGYLYAYKYTLVADAAFTYVHVYIQLYLPVYT